MSSKPFIAVVFGRAKAGKTASALRCLPGAHGITATADALAPLLGLTRVRASEEVVSNLKAAAAAARKAPAGLPLIYDDVNVLAERSKVGYVSRGLDGWPMWQALHGDLFGLRDVAMERGTNAIFVFHERKPEPARTNNRTGEVTPATDGGPKLPSQNLTEAVPAIGGIVVRAVRGGPWKAPLWDGVYECGAKDWITGDRYNVLPARSPQALREIVVAARALGHDVDLPPRAPGLEWLDDTVEWLCEGFLAGGSPKQAIDALAEDSPSMPSHLRAWAVEDAAARAFFQKTNKFAAFGVPDDAGGHGAAQAR